MPMQHSARPTPPSRNRSVRTARCRATLHMLHTQGLSRSPQTVPINTEAADQTCWSAACAYARRREKRPYLVAGECAGRSTVYTQPLGCCTTQCRCFGMEAPETRSRSPIGVDLRVHGPKAARVFVRNHAVLLHASHAPQGLGGRQAGCTQGGPEPGHGADEKSCTHAAAPGEGRYDDEFVLGRGVDSGR